MYTVPAYKYQSLFAVRWEYPEIGERGDKYSCIKRMKYGSGHIVVSLGRMKEQLRIVFIQKKDLHSKKYFRTL